MSAIIGLCAAAVRFVVDDPTLEAETLRVIACRARDEYDALRADLEIAEAEKSAFIKGLVKERDNWKMRAESSESALEVQVRRR